MVVLEQVVLDQVVLEQVVLKQVVLRSFNICSWDPLWSDVVDHMRSLFVGLGVVWSTYYSVFSIWRLEAIW